MKNFFLIIVTVICSIGCTNDNRGIKVSKNIAPLGSNHLNYKKKNFDSLLIANKVLNLDFYGELLTDKAFVNVLEHDSLYLEDVMKFLTEKPFTQDQAAISLCAMQNLKLEDYIKFSKLLHDLYDKNKITNFNLIEYAIWSPPEFLENRKMLIDNYNNPKVITLLTSISNDKKTPTEFKRYIDLDILSGKAKKDLSCFE